MSPRKLTEDDKQEILNLYRNSEATTSTLANDYKVSSSTISRFLKNKLSSVEYEDLIQQKRLARTPRGEKATEINTKTTVTKKVKAKSSSKKAIAKDKITKTKTTRKKKRAAITDAKLPDTIPETPIQLEIKTPVENKSEPKTTRRRRRRSSSNVEKISPVEASIRIEPVEETDTLRETSEEKLLNKPIIDRQPGGNSKLIEDSVEESDLSKANSLILKTDRIDLDEEEENSEVDLIAIKEMLGDDLEDFNDDDDDEEDDWEDETEEDEDFPPQGSALHDIEILPLSQASMPRICYLVIDRSAELIVKPLAEFADLGDIPQEEIKQRTLPVFDNHRIAKRFSHRRERVIKVPDGRMIQKTSHHLENKGITRLLIDGQIYSLAR